jgi:hypothetical protein
MSVGAFPGVGDIRRRTIRAPINPLDKSTIVSIYPKDINNEKKYTIQPGVFSIKGGTYLNPSILVVGPSSWWREIDEEQPLLEIPNSSIQIADSVVKDYCNGLLGCNMGDSMPGLFYVPGEFDVVKLKQNHQKLIDKARDNQRRWYEVLVKMADTGWSRTNGNPLTISDDMRLAARELNLNNKEWMKDFQSMEMVRCVACGSFRNPSFPVCQICKAIVDTDKAKELGIKFAQ